MITRKVLESKIEDGFRIAEIEETCLYIDDLREYGRILIEYSNILERIEKGENHEYIMAEKEKYEKLLELYEQFMEDWKEEMGKK